MTLCNTSPKTQTKNLDRFNHYHAVVGLITRNQKVLITQRVREPFQGFWEYPGGKIEKDESAFQALKRELIEEIAIEIQHATPIMSLNPRDKIWITIHHVTAYLKTPQPMENQNMRWCDIATLKDLEFLPGNEFILPYLNLKLRQSESDSQWVG